MVVDVVSLSFFPFVAISVIIGVVIVNFDMIVVVIVGIVIVLLVVISVIMAVSCYSWRVLL